MNTDQRIKSFIQLGKFLKQFSPGGKQGDNALNPLFYGPFNELIATVRIHNPWFAEENVRTSIAAIADSLDEKSLATWITNYLGALASSPAKKTVAVIMAGNIPMVGFHDMLCVLISGNRFIGKLSSEDKMLLPFIAKILIAIEPEYVNFIEFTEGQLKNMDAVIATGSNNSARYFDYYFGNYPHIIRKNRNSVAVITGSESNEQLRKLGKDIFLYYGLGCRNVSKLFVPENYSFDAFYQSVFDYSGVMNNNKYANNYDYNRTVYLMAGNPSLLDNNFLLLKEDPAYSSPIGVLFFEYYKDISQINERLEKDRELIQCILSESEKIGDAIPFGQSQCPALNDYADGVDTMKFLTTLQ